MPGATATLTASAVDAAGRPLPDRKIEWLSSDPARVTVSQAGVVTAVAPGIVGVSAISEGLYTTVDVRVSGPPGPIVTVSVTPPGASLALGQSRQFTTVLEDAEGNVATDRLVTWSSSAPNIATVSSGGLVTSLSRGTAIVEAQAEGRRGTTTVSVVDLLDQITFGVADPELNETVGDTLKIYLSVKTRNAVRAVEARVANRFTDLEAIPVGFLGKGVAWVGTIDLSDVHFGPYQLVVTATDNLGNKGIATVSFKRGAREGPGGVKLPPRSR